MNGSWTRDGIRKTLLALLLLSLFVIVGAPNQPLKLVQATHRNLIDPPASIAPSQVWGALFGTSGDVEIDLNRTGIAVRVEIPREFLAGVVYVENDTHFIESNIRNDYYYYSVVDESQHWTYDWQGYCVHTAPACVEGEPYANYTQVSDGPCFKTNFSMRDPNAPWCVEIWNYLNGTFLNFTSSPPKFIRFLNLNAPSVAGIYNFTVSVADHTNSIGYPDFVNATNGAWSTTLFVPVSMQNDPASISGTICDLYFSPSCPPILGTKGIAYAQNSIGQIVARSYVNETTGQFNITGLAPGSYQILASAGFDRAYNTTYSQGSYCATGTYCVSVLLGGKKSIGSVQLNRAPQVCGLIEYIGLNNSPLSHALTGNPYLSTINDLLLKGALNVTVEATDSLQHVYRDSTILTNNATDPFTVLMGSNVSYVGTDPYGTEFAGLPSPALGSYQLTVNVWIAGYVQVSPATVVVSTYQQSGSARVCNGVSPSPVLMHIGGVISGQIQFWNQVGLETPDQAEASLPLREKPTGALFGGNILIQVYDHSGILRAVSVIDGTAGNETTSYKDSNNVTFEVFGFDEYLNHTWSGVWNERDYGLGADSGYSIQVYVRGYEEEPPASIALTLGGAVAGVQVRMLRGGAFKVGVFSYDNRLGGRVVQAPIPFPFLNFSIPIRARIYFYDSGGREVGFVECRLRVNVTQPDPRCHLGTVSTSLGSQKNSFTAIFAGQNWSLREIWFYGDIPTYVTNENYTIKTYVLGYVWQYGPTIAPNSLLGFTEVGIALLIGDEIDITGPIFVNAQLFGKLPENDYVIGQAFGSGGLAGATPCNVTAGNATLGIPILGFGGQVGNGVEGMASSAYLTLDSLNGQGHFFYESPDGSLYFDYGLDNTTSYLAQVPEFGFNQHFMQPVPPAFISFSDLFLETGVVMQDIAMATVTSGFSFVTGWCQSSDSQCPNTSGIVVLSWVSITASNATFTRSETTLDGQYLGAGALFLPQGTYNILFSNPFFISQTQTNFYVQWGGTYAELPPNEVLCPTVGTCDPPSVPSFSQTSFLVPSLHSSVTWIVACYACPLLNPTRRLGVAREVQLRGSVIL